MFATRARTFLMILKVFFLGDRVKSAHDIIANQGTDKLHGDLYTKFVRSVFFPFILRFHNVIILSWLVVFCISIAFGPSFLSMTRDSFDLPSNVPSAEAITAYSNYFPTSSDVPPILLYQHNSVSGIGVTNQYSHAFSNSLKSYTNAHSAITVLISIIIL